MGLYNRKYASLFASLILIISDSNSSQTQNKQSKDQELDDVMPIWIKKIFGHLRPVSNQKMSDNAKW